MNIKSMKGFHKWAGSGVVRVTEIREGDIVLHRHYHATDASLKRIERLTRTHPIEITYKFNCGVKVQTISTNDPKRFYYFSMYRKDII